MNSEKRLYLCYRLAQLALFLAAAAAGALLWSRFEAEAAHQRRMVEMAELLILSTQQKAQSAQLLKKAEQIWQSASAGKMETPDDEPEANSATSASDTPILTE